MTQQMVSLTDEKFLYDDNVFDKTLLDTIKISSKMISSTSAYLFLKAHNILLSKGKDIHDMLNLMLNVLWYH